MSVAQVLIQEMQEVFMDCLFTDRYILYKLPRCMKTKVKGTHADINIERTTRTGISFSTSQVFQVRYTQYPSAICIQEKVEQLRNYLSGTYTGN